MGLGGRVTAKDLHVQVYPTCAIAYLGVQGRGFGQPPTLPHIHKPPRHSRSDRRQVYWKESLEVRGNVRRKSTEHFKHEGTPVPHSSSLTKQVKGGHGVGQR